MNFRDKTVRFGHFLIKNSDRMTSTRKRPRQDSDPEVLTVVRVTPFPAPRMTWIPIALTSDGKHIYEVCPTDRDGCRTIRRCDQDIMSDYESVAEDSSHCTHDICASASLLYAVGFKSRREISIRAYHTRPPYLMHKETVLVRNLWGLGTKSYVDRDPSTGKILVAFHQTVHVLDSDLEVLTTWTVPKTTIIVSAKMASGNTALVVLNSDHNSHASLYDVDTGKTLFSYPDNFFDLRLFSTCTLRRGGVHVHWKFKTLTLHSSKGRILLNQDLPFEPSAAGYFTGPNQIRFLDGEGRLIEMTFRFSSAQAFLAGLHPRAGSRSTLAVLARSSSHFDSQVLCLPLRMAGAT